MSINDKIYIDNHSSFQTTNNSNQLLWSPPNQAITLKIDNENRISVVDWETFSDFEPVFDDTEDYFQSLSPTTENR